MVIFGVGNAVGTMTVCVTVTVGAGTGVGVRASTWENLLQVTTYHRHFGRKGVR